MPYPLPLTRTEAYLAYKAGVIQQSDLKPSLAVPRNGIDAWLAYWTGLTKKFPIKGITKNLWEWNKDEEYSVTNRTTYEIDGDNNLVVSTNSGSYQNVTFLLELEDGEYTFSLGSVTNTNPSMTVKRMTLATRNSDGSGRTVVQQISAGTPRTVTITNEPNKIYTLEFWGTDGTSLNNTATYSQVQIEKGDKATVYEPYTGEPEMLTEEEAFIAYLSGVINEYPEKCLRRVGAYLRYIISARWGRPDHPLNREELYLSLIKTQFIPSGDPSSDIVINGTAKAPFVDVKMYGDTFQQSYTGKNFVGFPVAHLTDQDGLTLDFASDGTITIDGTRVGTSATTYNDSTLFNYKAGSFTLTVIPISGSFSGAAVGTRAHKANLGQQSWYQTYTSAGQYNQGTLTKTAEEIAGTVGIQLLIGSGRAVFDNFKFKLQVTAGSDHDTDYEPFVGGTPSPSPDYPQPIQTVTGEQTVKVTGKNLFDKDSANITNYYPGTGQMSYYSADAVTIILPVVAGETYTASTTDRTKIARTPSLAFSDEIITSSGTAFLSVTQWTSASSVSATAPNGAKYMYLYIKWSQDATAISEAIASIQVELGSTATAYTPYSSTDYPISLGSIELCKLGTYQDYIWKDGEDWKVHKATVSAIIDGSESWDTSGTNTFYVANIYSKIGNSIQSASTGEMYASHFTIADITSSNTLVGASLKVDAAHNVSNLRIRLQDMSGGTAGFRQMLSAKKPSIYARRLTPTDTTITDQTLIAQLDSLVNGGAEDGTTYIKVNATDPNLPGLLYVEAPKYE